MVRWFNESKKADGWMNKGKERGKADGCTSLTSSLRNFWLVAKKNKKKQKKKTWQNTDSLFFHFLMEFFVFISHF